MTVAYMNGGWGLGIGNWGKMQRASEALFERNATGADEFRLAVACDADNYVEVAQVKSGKPPLSKYGQKTSEF